MSNPIDRETILAAIGKLGDRVADHVASLEERIDGLAEAAGHNFARVDAKLDKLATTVENLATEVGAMRFDVAAHRMETRAAFNRHDARIAALEEKSV